MTSTRIIIEQIIDKYEGSTHFKNRTDGNLSITLYDCLAYLESENRDKVNKEIVQLVKRGVFNKISWYDPQNIIGKISFSTIDMDQIYQLVNRKKKNDILHEIVLEIKECQESIHEKWINSVLEDFIIEMESKKRIPKLLLEDKKSNLLRSLIGIDFIQQSGETLLMRIFSKKYLGDSKIFEKSLKNSIVSLAKKYHPDVDAFMDDETILEELGIMKTSWDLYLKGDLTLEFDGEIIKTKSFPFGLGLNRNMLSDVTIRNNPSIKRLITIENKTNFESWDFNNEIIYIFSYGYPSPKERKFLTRILDVFEDRINYLHSGDLDLGGFSIYKYIKYSVFPSLKPFQMDTQIYNKYLIYGENRDETYLKKLNNIKLPEFDDLIGLIQKEKSTLEQEAFLIE